MEFYETPLKGAFLIVPDRHEDERGSFTRIWCRKEAQSHGLDPEIAQCNVSYNVSKGTLRGLHYQLPPFAEAKLVRCARGLLFDVLVDLRPESATFLKWYGIELTAQKGCMLYIPQRFAHGFLTLEEGTEVAYQMSDSYEPAAGRGIRWDDPRIGIAWPSRPLIMSERDRCHPDVIADDLVISMLGAPIVQPSHE